jgi:lipopolysaccharide export LptBFGC system permease protein LptF
MVNRGKLPDSINIQILYISYKLVSSAILIYPLALLFGMISTIVLLIKQNELIAYFSLGYSPKKQC